MKKSGLAEELGLVAGDKIVSVNGTRLRDIIDVSFAMAEEEIELLVEHADGEQEMMSSFAHQNTAKDCYFLVGIATKDHSSFSVVSQMISSDSKWNNLYLINSNKEKTSNLGKNPWQGTYGISFDFEGKNFFIYVSGKQVAQQNLVFDPEKECYFVLTNGYWGGDTGFNSPVLLTMNFDESAFTNPCPAGFTPVYSDRKSVV